MDRLRYECFNKHATKIGLHGVWPEIIIYRSTGQVHSYFLHGQSLRGGKGVVADFDALDELEVLVVGWLRLAAEDKLSDLEEQLGIKIEQQEFESLGEWLKLIMQAHKESRGFQSWTYEELNMLRYEIYQLVEENGTLPRESPAASNGKWHDSIPPFLES